MVIGRNASYCCLVDFKPVARPVVQAWQICPGGITWCKI